MTQSPLSWNQLHDATLLRVECRWTDGRFSVYLRTGLSAYPEVQVIATGGRRLNCPRMQPWGSSVSVNEVRGPTQLVSEDLQRLEIEMQSGDVLVLDAEEFRLVTE